MQEFLLTLSEPWAVRALITSSLVGVMCGVLGCFIVLRNMSLIGDALSHAILPGIFVAFLLFGYSTIGFFIGSTVAGLITAVLISWIQQNVNTKNDAAIGIIFTAMFAIGVIGISWLNQSQGVHLDLKDFLFGNILGISNEDIYLTLGITIYTIVSIIIFYRYLFITTFQETIAETMGLSVKLIHYFLMLLLSFAVVASLRSVGVILVVAMLITPAATALLLSTELKKVLVIAGVIGLLSAVSGLFISILFETTPGPAMTLMATFYYLLAVIFSPQKGILFKHLRNLNEKSRVQKEDIVKAIFKTLPNGSSIPEVAQKLNLKESKVKTLVSELAKNDIVSFNHDKKNLVLSKNGNFKATKLVRAHRLWETYQVNQMGLQSDQIHEDAERVEHHISTTVINELEKELGYPENDPHGSPIPKNSNELLSDIPIGKTYKILKEQLSPEIESFLWDKNISHTHLIQLISKKRNLFVIKTNQNEISIPINWAKKILVNSEN